MDSQPKNTDRTPIKLPNGVVMTRGQIIGSAIIRSEKIRATKSTKIPAPGGIGACIKRGIAVLWRRKRTK